MSKLYLFAIGGSGSRVLKQFVMMLASGVDLGGFDEVRSFVIDYDAENSTNTVNLLKDYITIHYDIWKDTTSSGSFFGTKMFCSPINDSGENKEKNFGDYLKPLGNNKEWSDLLFSNIDKSIKMGNKGFEGHPHVGSVVFANLFSDEKIQSALNGYSSIGGDRIFIISSIFGGTGAAGFPALVKKIKAVENKENPYIIGGVSLQPYFKVDHSHKEAEKECSIESSTFLSKTQVASDYYKEHLISDINLLYVMGDKASLESNSYPASNGGTKQEEKDPPHLIEFLGAAAIVDFLHQDVNTTTRGFRYVGCDEQVEGSEKYINFDSFGDGFNKFKKSMSAFYLFSCFMKNSYAEQIYTPWLKNLKIIDKDGNNLFKEKSEKISEFCKKYHTVFLGMSNSTSRKFKVFNLDNYNDKNRDCMDVLYGKEGKKYKRLLGPDSYDYVCEQLNKKSKEKNLQGQVYEDKKVMELFSETFYDLINKRYFR